MEKIKEQDGYGLHKQNHESIQTLQDSELAVTQNVSRPNSNASLEKGKGDCDVRMSFTSEVHRGE